MEVGRNKGGDKWKGKYTINLITTKDHLDLFHMGNSLTMGNCI